MCIRGDEEGLKAGMGPRPRGPACREQELRPRPRPTGSHGRVLNKGVTDQDCGTSG